MNKKRKIYTKTGDKGRTALIGGTRVPKYDSRIEAYGTVDELNSYVGLIRDQNIDNLSKELLLEIQDRLFTLESSLAQDEKSLAHALPGLLAEDVELLEKEIDKMNEQLPELTAFILPGGHPSISYCHVARTRSEEHTSELQSHSFISYAVFCLKKKKYDNTNFQRSEELRLGKPYEFDLFPLCSQYFCILS